MQELSIDLIGPLPITPRHRRFMLVVLDKLTKFVESFPLCTQTPQAIVDKLVEVSHGAPHGISSDHASHLIARCGSK